MTIPLPRQEPLALEAGSTLYFTRTFPDYPISAGWTLRYFLQQRNFPTQTFDATAGGDEYLINVPGTTTAAWDWGDCRLSGFVIKTPDRFPVFRQRRFILAPDPATLDPTVDTRSFWEQALEAAQTAFVTASDREEIAYSLNGRSFTFPSKTELSDHIFVLKSMVATETWTEQRKILVRYRKARI